MMNAEDQFSGASTQDALSPQKIPSTSSSALIKKDSIKLSTLYKPILRRFRSYIRSVFDQGRKQSLYQHWSHDTYLNNTRQFMDRLKIPIELRDHDNVLRLLTIIFPCTVKYIEPNHIREERLKLVSVFRENCVKNRQDFFSEPIIQFLWTRVFLEENPNLVSNHLRRLKSEREDGDIAVSKFIKSIKQLED